MLKFRSILVYIGCLIIGFLLGFSIYPHQIHLNKEEENYQSGVYDGYFEAIYDVRFGNLYAVGDSFEITFESTLLDSSILIGLFTQNFEKDEIKK